MLLLMLMKKKLIETILVDSFPNKTPDNYNQVNLHLAETICSTIAQFKALIEKTRKFTKNTVQQISGSKKVQVVLILNLTFISPD